MMIGFEFLIIVVLLLITRTDFFAFLFVIPLMQAMQQFTTRITILIVCIATGSTFLILLEPYRALLSFALAIVFLGGSVFLVAYIWSTHHARLIQDQQHTLACELQQANHMLEFYTQQIEQIAARRKRQRLASELHDSVIPTIFSMTLTTQVGSFTGVVPKDRIPLLR